MKNVFIDKLHLFERKFSIHNDNNITVEQRHPPNKIDDRLLFSTVEGRDYLGTRGFVNNLKYSHCKIYYSGIYVNVFLNEKENLNEQLERATVEFENSGIEVNFNQSIMTRIDIARDIKTRYSFYHYYKLIQFLASKMRCKVKYKDETIYLDKPDFQIVFYDKSKQIEETKGIEIEDNTLRCEIRLKKPEMIVKQLGSSSISILNTVNLEKIYNNILKSEVFDNANLQEEEEILNLDQLIENHTYNEILTFFASEKMKEYFDSKEQLRNFISQATNSKTTNWRRYNKIISSIGKLPNTKYNQLLNELHIKLTA